MAAQPATASGAAASGTTGRKTSDAAEKLKMFGSKLKGLANKAVDNTKKFVKDTEQEIKMTESMEGLVTMAITEFQSYIKQRADTTDKNKTTKEIADSFKDCVGIVFVASFNVAFTVGGSYGRGIVMSRLNGGNWSLPLAIQEIEGSVGWQLNVSRTKTFYVLKNETAVKNFQQKQNVKLGGKGFAAIGNKGIQAQGDVQVSKDSLTKTTGDAKEVASTNASVGSAKGVALGVNVNAGTFQPCKKVNDATYDAFDVGSLFASGVNDAETSDGKGAGKDDEKQGDRKNRVKSDKFVPQLQELIQLMEGVIQMEKSQDKDKKAAEAAAAEQKASEASAAAAASAAPAATDKPAKDTPAK